MRRISLVDHTKRHEPEPGVLEAIAEALTIQIDRDFAPAWGIAPVTVRVGGSGEKVHLFDGKRQAADLGWHTVDAKGLPYAHVFIEGTVQAGSDWTSGTSSVAAVAGHEVLEMLVDPCANEYAYNGYRQLWAIEVCDPVQEDGYGIRAGGMLVPVTDFVLPAFFNAWADGPYDHLGILDAPFTLSKGGYAVCQRKTTWTERFRRRSRFEVEWDDRVPSERRDAKLEAWGRTYWRKALLD